MNIEELMIDIMDLANEKFRTKNVPGDPIEIGTHFVTDEEGYDVWVTWLQHGTTKSVKRQNGEIMTSGGVFEAEIWCVGEGYTLEEALQDTLTELQEAKMKRGNGNRLVPVLEE